MISITISVIALLVSIVSLGFSVYLSIQNNKLKLAQMRTQILNQLVECRHINETIKKNMMLFADNSKIVFPEEKFNEFLDVQAAGESIENIYNELSDYSKKISPVRLEEITHNVVTLKKLLESFEEKSDGWSKRMKFTVALKKQKD